jgi:hypothetical protein
MGVPGFCERFLFPGWGWTASWAGDSPSVSHRHYKVLVKEADAKGFWEINPDNVAKIIPMPCSGTQAAIAAGGGDDGGAESAARDLPGMPGV